MVKFWVAIIISIALISLASANIEIDPNPLDIITKVNQENTYSITIKNNYDFGITDMQFSNISDYGFSFPNITIPKNSSKTFDLTLKATDSIHKQINSKVSFKYFVDLPEEVTTYEINITPEGFNPDYIIIRQGDSIKWNNNDDISHRVFSEFDYQVPVNSSVTHTFDSIETVNYYDPDWNWISGFSGTIEVINRSSLEKAHNPNYDINWVINLDSNLNPTNLTIMNSKSEYTIEYGKFKRGLLTIMNNGSETAEVVEIRSDSDWISFEKNNFDINIGEEEWIEYTITPIILDTNQTDKNYTLQIKIKASNSEEYIKTISVFVPYKEVLNELGESDVATINWLEKVFCPKFPTSFLCNQSVGQGGNNSVIYRDVEVPINISAMDWYDVKKDMGKIKDSVIRTENWDKTQDARLEKTLSRMSKDINQSLAMSIETKRDYKRFKNSVWIIGFFILLAGLITGAIKLINKVAYNTYLAEGQYQYRK